MRRDHRRRRVTSVALTLLLLMASVLAPVVPADPADALPSYDNASFMKVSIGQAPSRYGSVSPDGLAVGYVTDTQSGATITVALPRFGSGLQSPDTAYFSVDPTRAKIAEPADVVVSNGGRFAAFTALSEINAPGGLRSVYTVDVTTGMITRVDPDANLVTGSPSISDDGLTIAYDAAHKDSPDQRQIKVWDRTRRTNVVVSQAGGSQGNWPSTRPAISGDGTTIAFTTAATNLVSGMVLHPRHDGTGTEAVSLDRGTGHITLLSHTGNAAATATTGNSWITSPGAMSTDGTWAVFATDATSNSFDPSVVGDGNNATDVIRRNRATQQGRLISRVGDTACEGASSYAGVDDNGDVIFASDCAELTQGVVQPGANVFQSDGVTAPHMRNPGGVLDDPGAVEDSALLQPSVSADGEVSVWSTARAHPFDPLGTEIDDNGVSDVYLFGEMRSKPLPAAVEVQASDIRNACPDTTRSVVTAYPPYDPTHVQFAVFDDPSMHLAFTLTAEQRPAVGSLPERVQYRVRPGSEPPTGPPDNSASDPVRALVLELPDGNGGSKFVVFDEGIEVFRSYFVEVPGTELPINVAVCAPALAEYGPKAFPDTASALTGTTVQLDVLANDEGDLDRSSLTIANVSDGTATVVKQDGLPVINYTAPATDGPQTVDYQVTDYGGTTTSALATINVGQLTTNPLTLSTTTPGMAPGVPTPVMVTATNDGPDPVTGAVVSVRLEGPATVMGSGGGWTCVRSVDQRTVTCNHAATVASGGSFPALPLSVTTPVGPQQPCVAADPTGAACVNLFAWNGDAAAEDTATPSKIRTNLPYVGGVLRVAAAVVGSLNTGSLGTYDVTVANSGGAALPAGTVFELRSGQSDMPFESGDSDRFDCVADPSDAQRAICTSTAAIAAGDTESVSIIYTVGAGQQAGCPVGVVAPCAILDVAWIDAATPNLRVPLAQRADPVGEPTNPIPPDVTVQLTTPAVAWQGQATPLRVMVANAGLGPTTGPIIVTLDFPAGFVPEGASAPGWTCSVDVTTCTRNASLAAGAHTSTITVTARVGATAADGTMVASVATPEDSDPSNNTMSQLLKVLNGDIDDPDGPAHFTIGVEGPMTISPGATVPMKVNLHNWGTTDVDGPHTVAMLVPDGLPAGQVVTVAAAPSPWSCIDTALVGVREIRCTVGGTIAAGSSSIDLDLNVTGTALSAGTTLDLTLSNDLDETPIHLVNRYLVTTPRVAHFALASAQPTALRPGGEADLMVTGTNVGNAPPTGDLSAHVQLPAGVTIGEALGAGWNCTGAGTAEATCTADDRPAPGTTMSALVLKLRADENVAPQSADASVVLTSSDTMGTRTFVLNAPVAIQGIDSGELTLERAGLTGATAADRTVAYDVGATNAGRGPISGTLALSESLPLGTVVTGSGAGWTCATVATTVNCERPGTSLDPGQAATPVSIQATLPAGLAGGQAQLSAVASLEGSTGMAADAVTVADSVTLRPNIEVGIEGLPRGLIRGSSGSASIQAQNSGNAPKAGPIVVGLVLSRGLLPTDATGNGWTCEIDGASSQAAVACRRPGDVLAGQTLPPITVDFDVATSAGAQALLSSGLVADVSGAALAPILVDLVGIGSAALVDPGVDVRPVRGLSADAGPDQTVAERTPEGTTTVPTSVRLDGRGSSSGSQDMAWTWVQTEGPTVEWEGATFDVTDAEGATRQAIHGETPRFTVPRLTDSTSVDFDFELTATSGDTSQTDSVTVTVTPTPDAGPVMGSISTDLADIGVAPTAGTTVALSTTIDDPEGDPVSVRWEIGSTDGSLATATVSGGDDLIIAAGGIATGSLQWPDHATYVVVEATGHSSRGGVTTTAVVVGTAPPPPSVSVQGPAEAAGGTLVNVVADLTVGDPASIIWRWHQDSGPAIDPAVLNAATGPNLSFTAPSVSTDGEVIVVSAVATRIAGTATAVAPGSASIRLTPLPAPVIGISGAKSAALGAPTTLTATGVPAGSTIQWAQKSGSGGVLASPTATSTTFIGMFDGVAGIEVTVTDPSGRATSATAEVTVGAPFAPSGTVACEATGSLLNKAFAKATAGENLGATVGPVSFTLGALAVQAPCGSATPSLTFTNSTFSVAGGTVTGSGLSGTVSPNGVCITGGTLRFPDSWGLAPATVDPGQPICISLSAGNPKPITGSVTAVGLPFIKMPTGVLAPRTTVAFDGSAIKLSTNAALPNGGSLILSVAVDIDTGHFAGTAGGQIPILGTPVTFAGALSYDGSSYNFGLDGHAPGPMQVAPGTTISDVDLHVDRDGFAIDGTVTVNNKLELHAKGRYDNAERWSMSVAGVAGQADWSPLPGLTLPSVDFTGKIGRDSGAMTYDVLAAVPGDWNPVGSLKITDLTARLSNVQAPADCPTVGAGSVWLAVSGAASATFGSAVVDVDGKACVVPEQGDWSFSSTATLNSWKPLSGIDVNVESVGLNAIDLGDGNGPEITAFGSARAMGASLGAVVNAKGGSVVVDGFGSLSSLNSGVSLPANSTGHALFASGARSGYRFFNGGAVPRIDPNLAAVSVPSGISLYVPTTLSPTVRSLIRDHLKLPDVSTMVMSVHLGDLVPTFKSTVAIGNPGQGYTLYQNCGGQTCNADNRTRLALDDIAITISATGTFGFSAAATLNIAKSGETPASSLDMVAEVIIDVAGPKITLALYTTDGVWHGALGKTGLDLSQLAIQAGVNFGTAIPTPTLGFGAQIDRLPTTWAQTIGMNPNQTEPMYFGLNVSATNPIIDLQIGVHDGNTVIDPLANFVPGLLKIDYASVVIAPFGGKIGAKTYPAGFSLGFAATIAGVEFDAALAVNTAKGAVMGEMSLGTATLAGFTIRDVMVSFDLDPTRTAKPFSFLVQGAFDLPSMGSGPGTASGKIEITVVNGGLRAAVDIHAQNIGLAGVARLNTLDLTGSAAVGPTGISALNLNLVAQADILGATVGVAGSLKVTNNKLVALSAAASVQASIGPVSLTGPGCGGALGNSGACVKFAYGNNKIAASIDATLAVSGFNVTVSGAISDAYIQAAGSINIAGVGKFVVQGALYYGPNSELVGITEKDLAGVSRQVKQGDFKFAAAINTAKLGGFSLSAGATVLRLNNVVGVQVAGKATVPGGVVEGSGMFSLAGSTVLFDFSARGALTIDGHRIASVDVNFAKTAANFKANVTATASLPLGVAAVNASLSGSFSAGASGLKYDLTGAVNINVVGMTLATDIHFSNSNFSFKIHLGAATVFNVTVAGSLSSNGNFSATANANIIGFGALVKVSKTGANWDFTAQLKYKEHVLAWATFGNGSFTAGVGFQINASGSASFAIVRVGGTFRAGMHVSVTVAKSGSSFTVSGSFSGNARVSAWGQAYVPFYGWTGRENLGSLGARVDTDGTLCAEIMSKEFCL